MPSSTPHTKRASSPNIKRQLFDNNYFIGAIFGLFVLATLGALYLAIDSIMGGGHKYLYHIENNDDNSASSSASTDDTPSAVIEHLIGTTSTEKEFALHPKFLYEQSSAADDDYVAPPRVVEFYAPWCPHCQHYAPKYKKLSNEVTAIQPTIKFYAISCVAHKQLCKDQEIRSYPTIKLYKKDSFDVIKGKGTGNNVDSVLQDLGFMNSGDVEEKKKKGETFPSERKEAKANKKLKNDKQEEKAVPRIIPFHEHDIHDAWYDASLSFEFALSHAIYIENGPLSSDKQNTFKIWLELLSNTLPIQMSRTHGIINGILDNWTMAISGQYELDKLVQSYTKKDVEPRSWKWKTCTYGDNNMGYTWKVPVCIVSSYEFIGLWQLFHIVSVGVVEYNKHHHHGSLDDLIATRRASETLRNYIDHFFQCDVCRMNFLSMYDTCAFDGCHRLSENPSSSVEDWQQLPLWLWETHNDVNTRLLGERLELKKETAPSQWESQQARWPNLYSCPNCWIEETPNEEEIYKHLHEMYWIGKPTRLKISNDGVVDVASSNGGGGRLRTPLKWKLSIIIFATVALLLRSYTKKKVRHYSGKHKK